MGPDDASDEQNQQAHDELIESGVISDAEDQINDNLPDGYYCKFSDA
jgi:hypothetical protein